MIKEVIVKRDCYICDKCKKEMIECDDGFVPDYKCWSTGDDSHYLGLCRTCYNIVTEEANELMKPVLEYFERKKIETNMKIYNKYQNDTFDIFKQNYYFVRI